VNTYHCFHDQKRIEIQASTTAEAQRKAQAVFKLKDRQRPDIVVMLAAIGNEPHAHSATSI